MLTGEPQFLYNYFLLRPSIFHVTKEISHHEMKNKYVNLQYITKKLQ